MTERAGRPGAVLRIARWCRLSIALGALLLPLARAQETAHEWLELLEFVLGEGDREGARELLREAVAALEDPAPGEEREALASLAALDRVARELGSLDEQRVLRESVLRLRLQLHEPGHRSVQAARMALATTLTELGELEGALALQEAVHAAWADALPPDHPDLLTVKTNLGITRYSSGDLEGALELEEQVHDARARILPPDDLDLLLTKENLAITRRSLGDLAGALELQEVVLEVRARLLPPDHRDLLAAKLNLASTKKLLGDLDGAHELFEVVHEAWSRLYPADHPLVLTAAQNLAVTTRERGDLEGGLALEEHVHTLRAGRLPADHPELLTAKLNLAIARKVVGDLAGARALEEQVFAAWSRTYPADHPHLLTVMSNLAKSRMRLGDFAGALELQERVHEARARLLEPDHPDLLLAKMNLAGTRKALDDLEGGYELEVYVHAAWSRLYPPDHPELLAVAMNLAAAKKSLGDLAGARELEEAVLAVRSRSLPSDHPDLLSTKQNLAITRALHGDLEGALELEQAVLAGRERSGSAEDPDRTVAELNLAATKQALGDLEGARELVSSALASLRRRARALRAEAPRAAREGVREALRLFDLALYIGADLAGLEPELLATLESLRLAAVASPTVAHALAERPELAELAAEVRAARARLSEAAAAGPADGGSTEDWRARVLALAEERDRGERALRSSLARAGVFDGEVDAQGIGAALGERALAASFLRYSRSAEIDDETGRRPSPVDSMLAFVVRPDGAVARVELGPAVELEALVREWRAALGRPLAGRGVRVDRTSAADARLEELGRRLRARLLDPLLDGAGEVDRVHIVLDDFLHLVPLDGLPLDSGLVGERLVVRNEPTLARLLMGRATVARDGGLLVAGAIDYAAEPGQAARLSLGAATPPVEPDAGRAGSTGARFAFLPETAAEARAVTAAYEQAFGLEGVVLTGADATRAALFAGAARARFLHLATHGWFADERFQSWLDLPLEGGARDAGRRVHRTLTGFAPETLCGLALAGAARAHDASGRAPGILTAEELSAFDLRACELAVLSACETHVGLRRAGQGVQSLQAALHAAGARSAITSLWKVDDAATRQLFELFYAGFWSGHLGKAEALWRAKLALRAEGHPARDWAGWVMSGEPD